MAIKAPVYIDCPPEKIKQAVAEVTKVLKPMSLTIAEVRTVLKVIDENIENNVRFE